MQGEVYTAKPFGTLGHQDLSYPHLMAEAPDYYVFNGAVGALTHKYPLTAKVGERIRIFFGNAGPNKPLSLHAIGQISDKVYIDGSLESLPFRGRPCWCHPVAPRWWSLRQGFLANTCL